MGAKSDNAEGPKGGGFAALFGKSTFASTSAGSSDDAGATSASTAAAGWSRMVGAVKRLLSFTASLPLPASFFLELDRSEDGALDLERSWVTGQFRSKKLEAFYKTHSYATWRMRLRMVSSIGAVIEAWSVIHSFYCGCGARFGTYTGGYLVHACTYPLALSVCFLAILSPKLSSTIAPKFLAVFSVFFVMLVAGYCLPLIYYHHAHPLIGNATSAESGPCRAGPDAPDRGVLWYLCGPLIGLTLANGFGTSVGVSVIPYTFVSATALGLFVGLDAAKFYGKYRFVSLVLPQVTGILWILNIFAYHLQSSGARQQFISAIYVQYEREVRVEQLQREKERLNYERQFAELANRQRQVAGSLQTLSSSDRQPCDEEEEECAPCPAMHKDEGPGGTSDGGSHPNYDAILSTGGSSTRGSPPRRPGGSSDGRGAPRHRGKHLASKMARRASSGAASTLSSISEPELTSLAHTIAGKEVALLPTDIEPPSQISCQLSSRSAWPVLLTSSCVLHRCLQAPPPAPLDVLRPPSTPPPPTSSLHDTQRRKPRPNRLLALGSGSTCAPRHLQLPAALPYPCRHQETWSAGHGPPGHGCQVVGHGQ